MTFDEHRPLVEIATACARECVRQVVWLPELSNLIGAYHMALEMSFGDELPTLGAAHGLAKKIEPVKNLQGYRKVPVTFQNGGTVASPRTIADGMEVLFLYLDRETAPDEFTKAFLQIHPYIDGNGRVAFILYNWLNRTLMQPHPLPDYFNAAESSGVLQDSDD